MIFKGLEKVDFITEYIIFLSFLFQLVTASMPLISLEMVTFQQTT